MPALNIDKFDMLREAAFGKQRNWFSKVPHVKLKNIIAATKNKLLSAEKGKTNFFTNVELLAEEGEGVRVKVAETVVGVGDGTEVINLTKSLGKTHLETVKTDLVGRDVNDVMGMFVTKLENKTGELSKEVWGEVTDQVKEGFKGQIDEQLSANIDHLAGLMDGFIGENENEFIAEYVKNTFTAIKDGNLDAIAEGQGELALAYFVKSVFSGKYK